MNLKESFRYQRFLSDIFQQAMISIGSTSHSLETVRHHNISGAIQDGEDFDEKVECDGFFRNDDVIDLMLFLIEEKGKLTKEINDTKHYTSSIDIDASVEMNKLRHMAVMAIDQMCSNKASNTVTQGTGYTFNLEGNQTKYIYDIGVETRELYDRDRARRICRDIKTKADTDSTSIEEKMVMADVDYNPPFNVNDSFEDCMEQFLSMS